MKQPSAYSQKDKGRTRDLWRHGECIFCTKHPQGSAGPHSGARTPLSPHARSRCREGSSARAALGAGCPSYACRAARAVPWTPAGGGARGPLGGAILEWRRAAAAPCPVPRLGSLPVPPSRPLRPAGGSMSVVEHVREMAAAGLHSNVRLLSGLLLTMSGNNP